MKIVETTFERLPRERLEIGFEGENLRATVRIDCASVFAEYPNATPALIVKPLFADAYPVVVDRNGTDVDWLITSEILSFSGDGEIQLVFYKDQVICKSAIAKIRVCRSLQVTGDMPDPVVQWIENANRKLAEVDAQIVELEGMVDTATDAATRAEQSASTASTKAEQAAGSAATATAKANEATQAAGTATAKATEAEQSAQTATQKATAAADSERIATAKAAEAAQSAQTATTKAEQAIEAAQTATEKAGDASASATAAQASATNAASSATAASASETAAKASETAAGASATQAAQSAQTANTAAQTATQKAAEATQSAMGAAQSAQTATTKAEEATEAAQTAQEAKTAVEQTAEQLTDSLEQIDQNTQDIAELDERKANIDGYYPDMTVGNAEQLNSSKFVENSEPYTLRTSGGTSDIGNREYLDAVVGGTVAWNQAVRDEASENSTDFAPIVTVTDAVEDAAGVKVKIEPVQDLHGFDHPWPAGGGVNKLCINADGHDFKTWTEYNQTTEKYTIKQGQGIVPDPIPVNEIIPAGTDITVSIYIESGMYTSSGSNPTISIGGYHTESTNKSWQGYVTLLKDTNLAGKTYTTTVTTTAELNSFEIFIYGAPTITTDIVFRAQIELGTNNSPSWHPYSNICPITGWDGVKVTRTGKNLWNKDDLTAKNGYYNLDGSFNMNPTWRAIAFSCQQGFTYTKSGDGWGGIVTYWYDDTFVSSTNNSTVTVPSGVNNVRFACQYSSTNAQLELSSAATDFEPYAGNTYSITLPTEAGTVYGGELTVNADGSGSLVVDRGIYIPQSTDGMQIYNYQGNHGVSFINSLPNALNRANGLCSHSGNVGLYFDSNSVWLGVNSTYIYWIGIFDVLGISTIEEFKNWLDTQTVQFVYPLTTPQTYTLTAPQIRTLLGTNNVWADSGDLALTYTGTEEHLTLESGKKYLARISGIDSMLLGSGQEITAAKGTDNVFDLTQMFGTAVADYVYGQGAAFFRKWFPNAVYPYNAGELRHVEGLSAHEMVGFNLFDKSTATDGKYINSPGTEISDSTRGHSAIIPVFPSTYYYCTGYAGQSYYAILWLDGNEQPITDYSGASKSAPFTARSPANARYAILNYHLALKDSVCFNLAHNGSRNGEYAPYEKHSYPLDSSVILRGIPKVDANGVYWDGDRYLPDGTVERRYGVVDLGTLSYGVSSIGTNAFYATGLENLIVGNTFNTIVIGYIQDNNVMRYDKCYSIDARGVMYFHDISCTTAAEMKSTLSGVYLVYELKTQGAETAQPYHSTQWVSDWGTEEFVSTGIVPVGHETRYPANLRDKLQHLPDAASGNGSYLITQTDGQMVLSPFPAPPSSAGDYVLKATVIDGVATYTWEVAT